jgi:hypothetical protein
MYLALRPYFLLQGSISNKTQINSRLRCIFTIVSPLHNSKYFQEESMYHNSSSQTRTYKLVENAGFSEVDLEWIKSLLNVSMVTLQKKSIRVLTNTEDAINEIIYSINIKYCNSAKAKLAPLF